MAPKFLSCVVRICCELMKVRDVRVNGENEKDLAVLLRVLWEHANGGGTVPANFMCLFKEEKKGEKEHFGDKNCIYNTDSESMALIAVL